MAHADPFIGSTVGERYRVTEEIGSGGMATVYRAEHQLLKKPVAVKILHGGLSSDEAMAARFEGEAIAAARLEHPNVVSITDFGRTPDGGMFLVMEHLEGTSLADLIADRGPLRWDRAVELIRQTLRGLGHAHDMGVVHRDIKPSNIMVVNLPPAREVAKIIDFGIAKIVSGAPEAPHVETQAGIIFGTADFLAPERLLGKGDSDPRSDLYAVGVILYEALTGQRPFHDDDPYRIVERALKEPLRPPSQIVPEVPAALDEVVLKAMARDPDERFQSAREMLIALDPLARKQSAVGIPSAGIAAFDAGPDGVASASPLVPFAGDPPRRRRGLLLLGGAVGAALLLVVILVSTTAGDRDAAPVPGMLTPKIPVPAAEPSRDLEGEIGKMVEQAGQGETVAERQRAFDRLVALGYGDRVPWLPMLSRDLVQLPTCEQRREVVAKLKKLNDPAATQVLEEAAARPENACLAADVAAAAPAGAPPAEASPRRDQVKKRRGGGGGHF